MRDNASEYRSEEMMQFLESKGTRSHFSTPKEQWQNGAAESTIKSIMMSARTIMAESGLGGRGRFWFKAAKAGKDARNVTYKERIGMSSYQAMYGEKKAVSRFRAFGCRAWVYLDKQRREKEEAHAESQGGYLRRVHRQHERVGILHSRGSENHGIK